MQSRRSRRHSRDHHAARLLGVGAATDAEVDIRLGCVKILKNAWDMVAS